MVKDELPWQLKVARKGRKLGGWKEHEGLGQGRRPSIS